MSENTINLTLEVWRQNGPTEKGRFETYEAKDISTALNSIIDQAIANVARMALLVA